MIVAPKTGVTVTTCSLKDNKFWKNSQSLRKDWNKKYASERSRRVDNLKDTFKFVTDIAKEDVEKFKCLHLEAFDIGHSNGKHDDVLKHNLDTKESPIESSIFDEDI